MNHSLSLQDVTSKDYLIPHVPAGASNVEYEMHEVWENKLSNLIRREQSEKISLDLIRLYLPWKQIFEADSSTCRPHFEIKRETYPIEEVSEDKKVLNITSYIRDQSNICFAHRLANRLEFLVEASKEEHPDEVAILPDSLRNFVRFLQSAINLNYPDVVLSPSKHIRAQWRAGPNRHFAAEFLTTGDANFVIFSPDPKHPEKTIRLSGLVSVDSLIDTVEPHGVLAWSSR